MKNGGAPHKPVLLLSIFRLIETGVIQSNKIFISPELVMEFKFLWSKLVTTNHHANFALPFFHMKSEPFWKLIPKMGAVIPITSSHSIRSFAALKESVAYAEIDEILFLSLLEPLLRQKYTEFILDNYFPLARLNLDYIENPIGIQIEEQMVAEDAETYKKRIENLELELSREDFEEEIYIRSGVFKREIPKIYGYQCAITGMRIESTNNTQMVDACHIVPFSESKDDTLSNGISLSPTLHRAFDRGLLTITQDYTVRVSKEIRENKSAFSLQQFNGQTILLPENKKHYPSLDNLRQHNQRLI